MRAAEFIQEGFSARPKAKMHHDHAQVQQGVHLARDPGGYDRIYYMNRLMMAAACADGRDKKKIPGVDASSWYEKYNTIHPYADDNYYEQPYPHCRPSLHMAKAVAVRRAVRRKRAAPRAAAYQSHNTARPGGAAAGGSGCVGWGRGWALVRGVGPAGQGRGRRRGRR